ncbi:hypothetical protein [Tenacibaculum agarivorans]|uniref:hypothetical protein n=1 Tax=Tenacibaculum agarivorans TaxID=1908389 RepID=UPI00094B97A5|nr:hypothetical protein [Tenacibaculum agarivorans]
MKKTAYLLLLTQVFVFCQNKESQLAFSAFKIIDKEDFSFIDLNEKGEVYYNIFGEKLVAKIDKKASVILSDKDEKMLLIGNETVTDAKGEYVFSIRKEGDRKFRFFKEKGYRRTKSDDKVFDIEWSSEGVLFINGKEDGTKIEFLELPKLYKVPSLLLLMLHPGIGD